MACQPRMPHLSPSTQVVMVLSPVVRYPSFSRPLGVCFDPVYKHVQQRVEDRPLSVPGPGDCRLSQVRRAEAKSHIVRVTLQW